MGLNFSRCPDLFCCTLNIVNKKELPIVISNEQSEQLPKRIIVVEDFV